MSAGTYGASTAASNLLVPHRLPGPPVEAMLLERENRFLARCRFRDGTEAKAHVPDRGRLLEILAPGARVWLFPAPRENTQRRTSWSLLIAEDPQAKVLVAIDPAGANARVRPVLEQGLLSRLGGGWQIRHEVTIGESRIDFLLTRGGDQVAVEVKSVGVVRDGIALFPDAPTVRGVKHLGELESFVGPRRRALLLFVAQRGDAMSVTADHVIDPAFAKALRDASHTVDVAAVRFEVALEGCLYRGEIPVRI